jgi:hypothetical protein
MIGTICALAAAAYTAVAQPSAKLNSTTMAVNEGEPRSRVEISVKEMPFYTSAYMLYEHCGNSEVYKLRGHLVPLQTSIGELKLGLGGTAQAVNKTGLDPWQEAGFAGTFKYKDASGMLRFFPKHDTVEFSADYKFTDRVMSELRADYNLKTDVPGIRLGTRIGVADLKGAKIGLWLEGKAWGKDFKENYVGIGPRIEF